MAKKQSKNVNSKSLINNAKYNSENRDVRVESTLDERQAYMEKIKAAIETTTDEADLEVLHSEYHALNGGIFQGKCI